ncbi:hypothetical protein [Deinococcus marmoris]|uniref:hypothetical protein n=1 Tax=Deinococcus marmoris TaxID=249408 RepID=UPI000496959F|nr:hypothetical protein [Deinococcus marmoris]
MNKILMAVTALILSSAATAAPLTGQARTYVERLGRASGVSLSASIFTGNVASSNVATAFRSKQKCVSAASLGQLQAAPLSPGVRALVLLEVRCVSSVNGQPLTAASALALVRGMGLNLASDLDALLDDPLSVNRLLLAAAQPVTPITPKR